MWVSPFLLSNASSYVKGHPDADTCCSETLMHAPCCRFHDSCILLTRLADEQDASSASDAEKRKPIYRRSNLYRESSIMMYVSTFHCNMHQCLE